LAEPVKTSAPPAAAMPVLPRSIPVMPLSLADNAPGLFADDLIVSAWLSSPATWFQPS
jgi:hypothetical protein